ncbi:peptidoglycan DD-metalloendopeptidase family protein [Ornithinibacillus sp. L9]|uniref:Peptidoglycan DD-metalloendopeptidase family protein n=1 Tax=Ornithinibacillus caprae TaxID=2678566 RepID=A0A6N8FGL7_9BACI|nr:M23 family metallopeptidase [Ornithinibacillus caprae]MUK88710.1 peptidoglycan DD-metalloendopeptidase family protein [Ornithinibacillus caprae]
MLLTIIQVLLIQLLLPACFLYMLWRAKINSKLEWGTLLVATIMIITWLFLSGNWSWVSYYLRFVFPLLLVITIFLSWKKIKHQKFEDTTQHKARKFSIGVNVFLIIIFGLYNISAFSSFSIKDESIDLSFPLQNGVYYIGHGGSSTIMNYHHAYEPQQYALDIVKLNKLGTRTKGLYPKDLEKYEIFQDPLYSPCNGTVVEVRDGLPDLIPPDSNPNEPEGNYVALECEQNVVVYIAHMLKESVSVEVGDTIQEGTKIGAVGNSGNTSEPHLHIHAEKNGVGVPIFFDDKFLTRNSLVW